MNKPDQSQKHPKLKEGVKFYRSLFDNTKSPIMLLDEDGFFECNQATVELFGLDSKSDFSNYGPSDLSPEFQPDGSRSEVKAKEMIEKAVKEGHNHFNWTHQKINGVLFEAEVTLNAFEVEESWILQAFVKDISKELLISRELEEKNSYIQAILDGIPGLVSWIGKDYRYLGVNSRLAELYDLEPDQFVGKKIGFQEIQSDLDLEVLCQKLFDGEIENYYQVEMLVNTPSQGQRNYILTLNLFNNGKGIVLIGIDNTELRKTQIELAKEQENAVSRAKLASLGEMTAGIGHEISNPLSIVDGYLKRSLRKIPEPYKSDIEKASWAVERIDKIIMGLKRIARNDELESKKLVLLRSIIDDTISFTKAKLKRSGVTLQIAPYDEDQHILARHVQLCQVLLNLVINAKDAVEQLERKWIRIEIEDSRDELLIKVIDSGAGISKENSEKIFETCFTTKEMGKGTGLGLSLSKKIMKAHGGDLYLDESSSNTCFVIKLPKN
ncbi:ATP-binding protein [Halobacteriovorax sp. GB3]|uniref:PAS domain-containing sensor histidine kinase n=1 Tax=Halobacteriovorax sp. GB3 TaxID=2719615 RepID=UPI00235FD6A9|nr:ATP-binding protein [Halobacteriovorax sp. GB3]MDD0853736.1 ATP-binding protein [Halobacteriovorax sp. GB3]